VVVYVRLGAAPAVISAVAALLGAAIGMVGSSIAVDRQLRHEGSTTVREELKATCSTMLRVMREEHHPRVAVQKYSYMEYFCTPGLFRAGSGVGQGDQDDLGGRRQGQLQQPGVAQGHEGRHPPVAADAGRRAGLLQRHRLHHPRPSHQRQAHR
jgi:hypothetical protein